MIVRDVADKDNLEQRQLLMIQQQRTIQELQTELQTFRTEREHSKYRYLTVEKVIKAVEELNRSQSGKFTLYDLNCKLQRK